MKTFLIYSIFIFTALLSGCSTDKIPGVYRIDIQQGNAISQDMINKLKPGMTKNQVAFILGTPLLIDTFHPNEWHYIYSFQPGNGPREQRDFVIYFDKHDKLSHVSGDIRTVARDKLPQTVRKEKTVIVPLQEEKTGLFQGLLNHVGLGEDEPVMVQDNAKSNKSSTPINTKTPPTDKNNHQE